MFSFFISHSCLHGFVCACVRACVRACALHILITLYNHDDPII